MSGLNVEELLDSTANAAPPEPRRVRSKDRDDRYKSDRHDRDRHRDGGYRDRSRDRDRRHRDRSRDKVKKEKDADGDVAMGSPKSERTVGREGHRNKRRSRSRESDRHHSRRHRDSADLDDAGRGSGGDFYRGGGRPRTRSRSPDRDRYYRPGGHSRLDDEDRTRDRSPRRDRPNGRTRDPSPKRKSPTPQPTEDERDRRTVFVQQLAARLRTKELIQFFEKVGPVKEAQIVKDRVSGRSKG
jgi:RNA-binding protein 39